MSKATDVTIAKYNIATYEYEDIYTARYLTIKINGAKFRIGTDGNGKLDIASSSGSLIIEPVVSNSITLSVKRYEVTP